MSIPLFQVDAFTDTPFRGNPAAVVLLEKAAQESWMQSVAAEMNLAETAFLLKHPNGYNLRWFTPTVEVDLCGHATLASAHVLYSEGFIDGGSPITFLSKSGALNARQEEGSVVLDFPSEPCDEAETPARLEKALGAETVFVGQNRLDYLVQMESEAAVLTCAPNITLVASLGRRGIVITAKAETIKGADFVSRAFYPNAGIPEDPVTGSAHCMLGPYWQALLNRDTLTGYQASQRGGYVRTKMVGDRVELGGSAVTVSRGELTC